MAHHAQERRRHAQWGKEHATRRKKYGTHPTYQQTLSLHPPTQPCLPTFLPYPSAYLTPTRRLPTVSRALVFMLTSSVWSMTRFMYSSKPCAPAPPHARSQRPGARHELVAPLPARTTMMPSRRVVVFSYSQTCTRARCGGQGGREPGEKGNNGGHGGLAGRAHGRSGGSGRSG